MGLQYSEPCCLNTHRIRHTDVVGDKTGHQGVQARFIVTLYPHGRHSLPINPPSLLPTALFKLNQLLQLYALALAKDPFILT